MLLGLATILIAYGINGKVKLALDAMATLTLALPLTGVITNILKLSIGSRIQESLIVFRDSR
jgi:hypothetical protein